MSGEVVKIENVHKYFDQGKSTLKVLKGINITINTGEIILIMGPSGSGKSTLLSLIGALDSPTSGHIEVLGTSLGSLNTSTVETLRNDSIGFIFQFHYLLPEFNVIENIMMPGIIAGMPLKKARIRAMDLLHTIDFANRSTDMPDYLSGGERQKVALARAFFNNPRLIIADEPTGSLDEDNVSVVMNIIELERRKNGRNFIIATHDQRLTGIADRIFSLHNGLCIQK